MKKMIYFFLVACLFWCCNKETLDDDGIPLCESPPNVLENKFSFNLFKEGYSYPIVGSAASLYDDSQVKLYNETLEQNTTFVLPPAFNAVFLPEDSLSLVNKISKNFYLHLDSMDIDTIKMAFKIKYIEECFVYQFEELDIFYNDSLYFSEDNSAGFPFLGFTKK